MALTVNSTPDNISNHGIHNVTTDLTEDSSHVNLRIRAEIYHEGIVKAQVEKPKGIAEFDFGDILKTLVPGLKLARNTGAYANTGTIEATNLITGWSVSSGTWDTFTAIGAVIGEAIKSAAAGAFVETNDIAVTVGDIIVFYVDPFASTGANIPYSIVAGDNEGTYIVLNNTCLYMALSTGNIKILVGHDAGEMNFAGDVFAFRINTDRDTVGGLLAPYKVKFSEIYENSSGVTTTGATHLTRVRRFVPATTDNFTEYVMHDNACLFASETLRDGVTPYFIGTNWNREYFLAFFTEYALIKVMYRKNYTGGYSNNNKVCYEGWGVVILNTDEIFSSVTSGLEIYIANYDTDAAISATIAIDISSADIPEREILEYDGESGGKEYLAFEGRKDKSTETIREYYAGIKKNRKLIQASGIRRQKLETRFTDINNTSHLEALLVADEVKKLDTSYGTTDVTVITDSVRIASSELFTNQIDIEYEY